MTTDKLQKIFAGLPETFLEEWNGKEFKTCWYGSSALDKRIMELLDYSRPNPLIDKESKVDVFFYSDIDFFCLHNRLYSEYFGGEILFSNSLIWNHRDQPSNQWKDYILKGNMISADISLITGGVFPEQDVLQAYQNKAVLKIGYAEFWKYMNEIYTPADISMDLDVVNIEPELLNYGGFHLAIDLAEKRKIWDFIQFKTAKQKSKIVQEVDLKNLLFNAAMVEHKRHNGESFYTFYIDIDDSSFEKILMNHGVKIDVAASGDGWAGPGPKQLDALQCDYLLHTNGEIQRISMGT